MTEGRMLIFCPICRSIQVTRGVLGRHSNGCKGEGLRFERVGGSTDRGRLIAGQTLPKADALAEWARKQE